MKIQSINNLSELILVGIIFDMTIKTFEASGVKKCTDQKLVFTGKGLQISDKSAFIIRKTYEQIDDHSIKNKITMTKNKTKQ